MYLNINFIYVPDKNSCVGTIQIQHSGAHLPKLGAVCNLVGGGREDISFFFSSILFTVLAFISKSEGTVPARVAGLLHGDAG